MATPKQVPSLLPNKEVAKKPPQSAKAAPKQNEALIKKLKDEIWDLLSFTRKENDFWLGKRLCQLQMERAKPGSGTYLSDLKELGIHYWTAQRRINFYGKVMAGHDPTPARLLQNANDAILLETEDVQAIEAAALKKAIDEELARREAAIKAERDQTTIDIQKNKKRNPDYRVWIHLPSLDQRKRFYEAWQKIGHKRASSMVIKLVLDAANRHKRK